MIEISPSRPAAESSRRPVRRRALALLGALLLLAPLGASAQQVGGRLEAGVLWGRSFGSTFARGSNEYFDRDVEGDSAISAGVRLAYNLSERLSLELQAQKVDTRFVETADGLFASRGQIGILQMRFIEAGPRFNLARGRFVPFVGGGAGLAVLDPDIPDRPDVRDGNRLALHLVAGVRAYLIPHAGVRLDVRPRFVYLGAGTNGDDSGLFSAARWSRQIDGDLGIFVAF
ncbi:MAG: outer membrane beta-barrel protein [Thermoanaerobaculia bacterium]